MVTLSPLSVAPVCRVGDPLQLTCTASVDFIRWRVFQINEQGMNEKVINDEIINSMDTHQMSQSRVNSATVTITRTSAQGELPLVSTLSIDSVDISLNGTVVNCTDVVTSTNASTAIHIIDVNQSKLINEFIGYVHGQWSNQ